MEDYDDLGPPTHPNELALGLDISGVQDAVFDEGAGGVEIGGTGEFGDGAQFEDAPELNADFGEFGQVKKN